MADAYGFDEQGMRRVVRAVRRLERQQFNPVPRRPTISSPPAGSKVEFVKFTETSPSVDSFYYTAKYEQFDAAAHTWSEPADVYAFDPAGGTPDTSTKYLALLVGVHEDGPLIYAAYPAGGAAASVRYWDGWRQGQASDGGNYVCGQVTADTLTTFTLEAEYLYSVPWLEIHGYSLDNAKLNVTVAGNEARWALYTNGTDPDDDTASAKPTSLVEDLGILDVSTTGGHGDLFLTTTLTADRLYWMVIRCDQDTEIKGLKASSAFPLFGNPSFLTGDPGWFLKSLDPVPDVDFPATLDDGTYQSVIQSGDGPAISLGYG